MDLIKIFHDMTVFGWSVVVALLLMSFASTGITIERMIAYGRAKKQSLEFARFSGPLFKELALGTIAAAKTEELYRYAYATRIIIAGIEDAEDVVSTKGKLDDLTTVSAAMQRAGEQEILFLRRGTTVVATVGASAPFVGLLGTVLGIISAFQGIAETGAGGIGAVSAGISEALIATAVGLLVAIPATWMYNYFNARVEGFQVQIESTASEVLDYLLKHADELSAENFERPSLPRPVETSSEG